MQYFIAQRYRT
ncbi:hypothetical protein MTR67_013376 [Solanum verrucosum]|uniref:Uncharacterized protein n=1 Tax=Solanum verrucosum TaxID=315347 RepID=A0AAF0QG73_SOLVR|nr:hypothetical protein MTR67_013376 [Solanum verrucosum]